MQSKAATVQQYIAELPEDRRTALLAVREVILKNLDKGFVEGMGYGMMGWSVPHSIYPAGYHCDPKMPLPFAGLASQKNHMSLYMMGLYTGGADSAFTRWFRDAWARSGKKKLDMGKSCIRFKKLDDIPLEVIGEAFRRMTLKSYLAHYEQAILSMNKGAAGRAKSAAKPKKIPAKSTATPRTKLARKAAKKTRRPSKTAARR